MGSNYERRYGLKRHGIETMLALMSQIANAHALGLLVIDEIQHLSRSRSGGSQEMLNFCDDGEYYWRTSDVDWYP